MRLDFKGFELKSLDDSQGEGVFSGYASTWDKDLYDDVIVKALSPTLCRMTSKVPRGHPDPLAAQGRQAHRHHRRDVERGGR